MADTGDHARVLVDQHVIAVVATHPTGSLSGLVQMLALPTLNGIGIATILGRNYTTFLVPGFMMAPEMLRGSRRSDGAHSVVALIIGLRGYCGTGHQQSRAYRQDKFRFHDVFFVNAKPVAEPQVEGRSKCRRTRLPGGETVPKAWLLRL